VKNGESNSFETARVTSKGQITVPKNIREQLGIGEGDRIAFVREEISGRIVIEKVGLLTFRKLADEIAQVFKEQGITEEEAHEELKRIRKELGDERNRE
jgi:antitoxin PrlF